ncbi:related to Monoglyceride lipase [Saccharomycodes ludwigii]|uniref:Related to Monoglyceride lipase n=1 Tax=Saccharomycodes ludwigii TaxID=36035 RepID=A0A376B4K4_9ASCO|nr:hypothetical protein SCDLUD_004118 [Saccharomycodes ludwigii]KAH3899825.1 hypothetical protein SCDLUD_004118 [Saccharomycodes ludwigii]SSD59050.1 related to Monoglyceride lipase [Saccharomycodes ludwigii]
MSVKLFPNLKENSNVKTVEYPYKLQSVLKDTIAPNSLPSSSPPSSSSPPIKYIEFNKAKFATLTWPSSITNNGSSTSSCPKCRIFIVHGFGEYSKLYYKLMDQLSLQGVECFFFDQRGAGYTSPGNLKGKTDEYHTFNDLDHFLKLYIDDNNKKDRNSGSDKKIPLYLYGHSMGGGIILNYGIHGKYKQSIDGIIATGPLILLHPHTRPNALVLKCSWLISKMLGNVQLDTGLDIDGVTGDSKFREYLINDFPNATPCVGSFRQIYDFLIRGMYLVDSRNETEINKNMIKKPLLILCGDKDSINDYKASVKFVKEVLSEESSGNSLRNVKTYPGGRHSLHIDREEIFQMLLKDILKFVEN